MSSWTRVLSLDENRQISAGSTIDLNDAIRRGADLHVVTRYRHAEHVDAAVTNEVVDESMNFRVTCLIDDRWSAGFTTARVPVVPPNGFGPRPSLSLFLYNQDGLQALARPFLDAQPGAGDPAAADSPGAVVDLSKYHAIDSADNDTLAPIRTFVYDFDFFHYLVRDVWREVEAHDSGTAASPDAVIELGEAFTKGCDIKVSIGGLNDDLTNGTSLPHEVFVHVDHLYHYKDSGLLIAATQPVVRTAPVIPVVFHSGAWDFGWLLARSDGYVDRWLCDPRTQRFGKSRTENRIRWFVSDG